MFHVRRGVTRLAAAAVAGAGCLAAAACGGSAASLSAVPLATRTADPLAGLTVAQLEAKAIADAKAASSVTLQGTTVDSGETDTISLAIKPGQGCTGTINMGSKAGSLKLIVIGTTLYLLADNTYWAANSGSDAQQVIALLGGRYIKASTTDKTMGQAALACDLSQIFSTNGKKDDITKGKVTTRDGVRVLTLNDLTDDSTGYLTDTATPLLVAFTAPKGSKDGGENATVTYGAPVTLTAPPASQVIDGSKIGL